MMGDRAPAIGVLPLQDHSPMRRLSRVRSKWAWQAVTGLSIGSSATSEGMFV